MPLQHSLSLLHVVPVARRHDPAAVPVAQQTRGCPWSAVQVTAVPTQTPPLQVSLIVQGLLSLHEPVRFVKTQTPPVQAAVWHCDGEQLFAVVHLTQPNMGSPAQTPLWHRSFSVQGLPSSHEPVWFCISQIPESGLQTLTVQGLPVSGQVVTAPGRQVPFWQVSPTVQRLPSSHAVPSSAFSDTQSPVSGSQTLTLHGSVLAGQVFSVPGTQAPAWQVSFTVQALSSALQLVPFSLLRTSQVPVCWSQKPSVH